MSRPETAAWVALSLVASAFLGYRSFQRELGVQRDINERARVLFERRFGLERMGVTTTGGW